MKKGWQTKKLGDVCAFDKRQGIHRGLPYVGLEHIESHTARFIGSSKPQPVKSTTFRFSDKHVLYGRLRPYLNKAFRPEFEGYCSTEIFPIKPRPELSREYLLYWLLADETRDRINATCAGARMPRADMNEVLGFEFPLPPLDEQQRIVGILDEAFDGIATAKANAEKNLQNARALFESHLQSVFTQRGKGWVERRLDQVCTFSSGGTPSKSKRSYWSGEIPWVSGRDMKSTQLSDSLLHISRSAVDESSTRMAPAGTLLILVRGMGLAHGAQIAELMVPCAFNQDIRAIHPESDLIPRYLLFALRDRINSSDNVLSSAAHGTLKIDSDELKRVMIPVPSRNHQQKVVATIDSLSEETQRLDSIYQQKLTALDALKKSLLQQAFSGAL
jgi:type I restriction enzyme, S subunit